MIRAAQRKDIPRIAEIIVFGKRVAYRDIFKRKGIGRKLIQYVLTEEREKQMKKIFLWVIADNISARRFYEANGLCASGDTCLIEGTDKTDMCYEMEL